MLTVCGLEELEHHSGRAVTHVLSILDPDCPDPDVFRAYDLHHRALLRFHDIIEPIPEQVLPQPADVEAILAFGRALSEGATDRNGEGHLLIHCHAGISRSTAAMAMLLAQVYPDEDESEIFARLLKIRPQAWPNSRMIRFADDLLARGGRLNAALGRLYRRQLDRRPDLADAMRYHRRGYEIDMAEASTLA
jgi:predicted protein tyrosine phosphatase